MKKWLKTYLLILIVFLIFISSFNFFMDPFWTFSHNHKYNSVQKGTDERQQKANYIYFTDEKYDTLLLGSSRTTYMNPYSFSPFKVFNFSASGMRPHEYLTYINFVIEDVKQPINNIILAVDFFGYLDYGLFKFDNADSIVSITKSPYYRWKILLSFDLLNNSFKNLRDYLKNPHYSDRYTRDLVKSYHKKSDLESHKNQVDKDIKIYANSEYKGKANTNYYELFNTIKRKNSEKNFIIYTTPVSYALFEEMIRQGHKENYKQWLTYLVELFGEVHHFMYKNSISTDYINYFGDSNHAYPETNNIIARTIMDKKNLVDDFGFVLTKDNIQSFF